LLNRSLLHLFLILISLLWRHKERFKCSMGSAMGYFQLIRKLRDAKCRFTNEFYGVKTNMISRRCGWKWRRYFIISKRSWNFYWFNSSNKREYKRSSPCDDKWKGKCFLWHTISICLGQNWKTERMVKLIAEADVLFWSLASRDEVSRKTYFLFGQCKI
jgi:hypothetical protein